MATSITEPVLVDVVVEESPANSIVQPSFALVNTATVVACGDEPSHAEVEARRRERHVPHHPVMPAEDADAHLSHDVPDVHAVIPGPDGERRPVS